MAMQCGELHRELVGNIAKRTHTVCWSPRGCCCWWGLLRCRRAFIRKRQMCLGVGRAWTMLMKNTGRIVRKAQEYRGMPISERFCDYFAHLQYFCIQRFRVFIKYLKCRNLINHDKQKWENVTMPRPCKGQSKRAMHCQSLKAVCNKENCIWREKCGVKKQWY